MATNNKDLAASIVELLGGSSNISTALHCVTRLRFNLRMAVLQSWMTSVS